MIRLPALIAEPLPWQLPLSDAGVCGVAAALFTDELDAAVARFGEVLALEPTLLLWSVCRSPCWRAEPPNDLQDVALWLAQHGLHVLRWDEDRPGGTPASPQPPLATWAELAEASVGVSRLAAEFSREPARATAPRDARETTGIAPSPALFGLLHNARAWLAASAPEAEAAEAARTTTCLPNWLVQGLDELVSPAPRNAAVAAVARAVGLAPGRAGAADTGAGGGAAGTANSGHRVRARWLEARPECSDFLPAAVRKLARLRQLEQQFEKTLETEKIEALQAFAYGASHEINNPLANISTRAQTLLRDEADFERRRKLAVMNSQAFRAHELIADLMLFARPPALRIAPLDLVPLLDQVLGELAADAQAQKTTLARLPTASPVTILADAGHLAAAVRSLCVNSLEALRMGGRIEVSVHTTPAPAEDSAGGEWVEIAVTDTGPGIPPEVRRHLFDPYFSGREAGRGLGLGLSKCWTIVAQHGGRIDVDSGPQSGATFRIRLPSRSDAASAALKPRIPPLCTHHGVGKARRAGAADAKRSAED